MVFIPIEIVFAQLRKICLKYTQKNWLRQTQNGIPQRAIVSSVNCSTTSTTENVFELYILFLIYMFYYKIYFLTRLILITLKTVYEILSQSILNTLNEHFLKYFLGHVFFGTKCSIMNPI